MMSTSTVSPVLVDRCVLLTEALSHAGVPALRLVTIVEEEDMVILTGRLPSYYLKQLAQEAVIPHLGQRLLANRITVNQH